MPSQRHERLRREHRLDRISWHQVAAIFLVMAMIAALVWSWLGLTPPEVSAWLFVLATAAFYLLGLVWVASRIKYKWRRFRRNPYH